MRLQVLHLPAPANEYPFALVVDDAGVRDLEAVRASLENIRDKLGARAVLVFADTVDVG